MNKLTIFKTKVVYCVHFNNWQWSHNPSFRGWGWGDERPNFWHEIKGWKSSIHSSNEACGGKKLMAMPLANWPFTLLYLHWRKEKGGSPAHPCRSASSSYGDPPLSNPHPSRREGRRRQGHASLPAYCPIDSHLTLTFLVDNFHTEFSSAMAKEGGSEEPATEGGEGDEVCFCFSVASRKSWRYGDFARIFVLWIAALCNHGRANQETVWILGFLCSVRR